MATTLCRKDEGRLVPAQKDDLILVHCARIPRPNTPGYELYQGWSNELVSVNRADRRSVMYIFLVRDWWCVKGGRAPDGVFQYNYCFEGEKKSNSNAFHQSVMTINPIQVQDVPSRNFHIIWERVRQHSSNICKVILNGVLGKAHIWPSDVIVVLRLV